MSGSPLNPPTHYLEGLSAKNVRMKASWRRSVLWLAGLSVGGLILTLYAEKFVGRVLLLLQGVSAALKIPSWFISFVVFMAPMVGLLLLIQIVPLFLVWWERKVAAHMQGRLGPMDVGGWHGWAQTVADGVKLFLKEIIEPDGIDKWVYRAAPILAFVPAYLSFAPIPFGKGLVALDFDIGLLFVMAVSGVSTIGILMAGWGSANKYSVLGGLRAAAQIVSFEIPRLLSAVPVVMWAGTMSLTGLWRAQVAPVFGWFPRWFIFYPVIGQIGFVIYLVTTIAETNRVPFDVPEAESELVAGFHTEYGGLKFAIFFMAEYAYVFVGSLLGTVLFLGGGAPLFPFLGFIPAWAWFLSKTLVLVFVFLWARWTFPRMRVDRIMDLCWKIFLPWTFINIVLAGFVFLWRG